MKKIDLGQTISIFANVGVIAGILFLAIELQQNNDLLSAQARAARIELKTDFEGSLYQNAELAEIIARAQANDELTEAEEIRLLWLGRRMLTSFQYVYNEYQQGMIEEGAISTVEWRIAYHQLIPRMEEAWSSFRDGMNPEFVRFMEENVVNER